MAQSLTSLRGRLADLRAGAEPPAFPAVEPRVSFAGCAQGPASAQRCYPQLGTIEKGRTTTSMPYEVTIHTVRPATAPRAIAALQGPLTSGPGKLLACWYSEIGALNQVLVIREYESDR